MADRFVESMRARTDVELIGIVTGPEDDWQPDAVLAAQRELANRNLSAERTQTLTTEAEASVRTAQAPLDRTTKWLVAGFAGTCVPGLLVLYFYTQHEKLGERRKARELLAWFGYGVAFWVTLLLLFVLARR